MSARRDLTDSAQNEQVLLRASSLLDEHGDEMPRYEHRVCTSLEQVEELGGAELEAIRVAAAKQRIAALAAPIHISVVWAMYKEASRIVPSRLHPHGEDFLREKVRQMEWLASG